MDLLPADDFLPQADVEESEGPLFAAIAYVSIMVVLTLILLAGGYDDASWMTFFLVNAGFAGAHCVVG